jgi:hypothetical protein
VNEVHAVSGLNVIQVFHGYGDSHSVAALASPHSEINNSIVTYTVTYAYVENKYFVVRYQITGGRVFGLIA